MKLTKRDVIHVIRAAQMTPGNFVLIPEGRQMSDAIGSVSDVKYDIIGAIVRAYLPSTRTFRELVNTCFTITKNKFMARDPRKLLAEANYLGALSAHFENITVDTDDVVDDSVREELQAFVERHFPESIEVKGA